MYIRGGTGLRFSGSGGLGLCVFGLGSGSGLGPKMKLLSGGLGLCTFGLGSGSGQGKNTVFALFGVGWPRRLDLRSPIPQNRGPGQDLTSVQTSKSVSLSDFLTLKISK